MNSLASKATRLLLYLYFILFLIESIIPIQSTSLSQVAIISETIIIITILALNMNRATKEQTTRILIALIAIISITSIAVNQGGYGSAINLYKFILGVTIFSTIQIKDSDKNKLCILFGIIWIYYLYLSTNIWNLYLMGRAPINPNTIGIGIFVSSSIIINRINERKKNTLLTLIVVGISFYGIAASQCRSAMLSYIIYLTIMYMPIIKRLFIKYKRAITLVLPIIGIIFAAIYAYADINSSNIGIDINSKKIYTGREIIWRRMFEDLGNDKANLFLGLGSKYNIENSGEIQNYHNWYLGVLYTFGLPIFILYFIIIFRPIRKIEKNDIYCALFALMIIGFSETLALYGLMQTYIYTYLILGKETKQ